MFVGSPETVAQRIAPVMRALDVDRVDLHYAVGQVPAGQRRGAIELLGREVFPRVLELLKAPGAVASTVKDVVDSANVIVLAVPAHRFRELPSDLFDGKILVDAMNYWPDTDGEDPELATADGGSTVVVQAHFAAARLRPGAAHGRCAQSVPQRAERESFGRPPQPKDQRGLRLATRLEFGG